MYILRKTFSTKKNNDNTAEVVAAGGLGVAGVGLGSRIKKSHLTGTVTRYHNTSKDVVDKILEEGLKAKYAEDPENLTNRCLQDVPMEDKKGLIYTAKKKKIADGVGVQREALKNGEQGNLFNYNKYKKLGKTLELEFDYDDIKNLEKIKNPELRGAKNWKELGEKLGVKKNNSIIDHQLKNMYKNLGDGTHIFRGDIDPSHIKGSKHFKKRGFKDYYRYAKNNPERFGKEAAKVAATGGLLTGAGIMVKKAYDKENKEDKNK